MIELIGKGSYGYVARGKCNKSGKEVALKVIHTETTTEYDMIKILREIQLMRKMNEVCLSYYK